MTSDHDHAATRSPETAGQSAPGAAAVTDAPEHHVTVLPSGIEMMAKDGERVMEAANRLGYYWPTSCGAAAVCARCCIEVSDEFKPALSEMDATEREALYRVRWRNQKENPNERLACQARVFAEVTVVRRFVRAARDGDLLPFA